VAEVFVRDIDEAIVSTMNNLGKVRVRWVQIEQILILALLRQPIKSDERVLFESVASCPASITFDLVVRP
jgi:hypothetical protein